MSFFGFDTSGLPQYKNGPGESDALDFENTYDGLGDKLDDADDALNDETFGGSGAVGKDFNFGSTTKGAKPPKGNSSATAPEQAPISVSGVSYAQAANAPNDDEFMSELWGSSNPSKEESQPQQVNPPPAPEKRILSLEEIEAQLTAIDKSQNAPPPPPQHMPYPQQQFGMPGMMPPPPQFGMMQGNGFMPPPPVYGGQFPGMPPQMMQGQAAPGQVPPPPSGQVPPQGPPNFYPMPNQPQPQPQPASQVPPVPSQAPSQAPAQLQPPALPLSEVLAPSSNADIAASVTTANKRGSKPVNLSQFPVLGSKDLPNRAPQSAGRQRTPQYSEQEFVALTPEQQAKAAKRQEKVSRIMRHSGIMNPKDKDFVTRFQLSQIVTDDPYNEDFYSQVFKVIHPKPHQMTQQQDQQNNSIAQAYLDQSGHKLGGRNRRADVALQRMQQQVQRAVTVAKERPKLTQYAREGALGKISFGTGKKPRQQLEIFSKAVQQEIEKEAATNDKDGLDVKKINSTMKKATISPASGASNVIKKYSKKDIMGILENIITNLMSVESESRLSSSVDTTQLWDSLKILEQTSPKVNDESEINPFIQCLNHAKALKIISRLFKFLSREQILTIATLIMSNLENLNVIKQGSYTKYEDKKVPAKVSRLVDTYSLTFTKAFMNVVQDFKFNEIIGLLVILIEHNNISYVSTTKIGLSILTTLLSRAELIRGEGSISATDLSEWSSCYDELFTSLESRINLIFPPHDNESDTVDESYVWQFLATLALGGKLNHQRIIVDEVRDQIFSVMNKAKALDNSDINNFYKKQNLLNNLNMFLVVMGLVADENEIKELQS